jgi:lipoate-protein ligase B
LTVVELDLGLKEYAEVWRLQKELVEERISNNIPDHLIIVEHPPVITVGKRGASLPPHLPIPAFHVERGGEATFHGPGQLVGYPIMSLIQRSLDIGRFVRSLEQVLIDLLRNYDIDSERVAGHPGVWVHGRKIASIGLAVSRWVTYHGFALNVNTDLSYFHLIRPCGLDPDKMTSMAKIRGARLDMDEVKAKFKEHFARIFAVSLISSTRHIQLH